MNLNLRTVSHMEKDVLDKSKRNKTTTCHFNENERDGEINESNKRTNKYHRPRRKKLKWKYYKQIIRYQSASTPDSVKRRPTPLLMFIPHWWDQQLKKKRDLSRETMCSPRQSWQERASFPSFGSSLVSDYKLSSFLVIVTSQNQVSLYLLLWK